MITPHELVQAACILMNFSGYGTTYFPLSQPAWLHLTALNTLDISFCSSCVVPFVEKTWRDAWGGLVIQSRIQNPPGRLGYEKQFFPGIVSLIQLYRPKNLQLLGLACKTNALPHLDSEWALFKS